jgi:apolipoprotein N-acyltransferase
MIPSGFGDFSRGEAARTLPYVSADNRHIPVGAVICYEDILPQLLRKVGALHPYLLVNLTNDAWYGADLEPMEHLALAVFGSVEQRTSMVRAVNSGISTFIDPNGRIVEKTEAIDPIVNPRPAQSLLVDVPLLQAGHTVFGKLGNLFAYLCAALTLLLIAATFLKSAASEGRMRRSH